MNARQLTISWSKNDIERGEYKGGDGGGARKRMIKKKKKIEQ